MRGHGHYETRFLILRLGSFSFIFDFIHLDREPCIFFPGSVSLDVVPFPVLLFEKVARGPVADKMIFRKQAFWHPKKLWTQGFCNLILPLLRAWGCSLWSPLVHTKVRVGKCTRLASLLPWFHEDCGFQGKVHLLDPLFSLKMVYCPSEFSLFQLLLCCAGLVDCFGTLWPLCVLFPFKSAICSFPLSLSPCTDSALSTAFMWYN